MIFHRLTRSSIDEKLFNIIAEHPTSSVPNVPSKETKVSTLLDYCRREVFRFEFCAVGVIGIPKSEICNGTLPPVILRREALLCNCYFTKNMI
jgi:hypothetical protein